MSRQTQGSMLLVASISGGIMAVAFVALMVIGEFAFSAAAFLTLLLGVAAGLFLFVAMHQTTDGPKVAQAPKAAAKPAPVAAAAAPAPATTATHAPAPAAMSGTSAAPAGLSAARAGGPDDLKKIKGVGPKLEQLLHSMGYYHYDQVAGWTASEVAWVDENLEGFKGRVSRDEWVSQAKTLAAGGETAFSKKVEDGGVY